MSKPRHNRYDNIWEIRQSGYPSDPQIQYELNRTDAGKYSWKGRMKLFATVTGFLQTVRTLDEVRLPVWKIVCPDLDSPEQGSIYYVVEDVHTALTYAFRATFGYRGTGTHEAALIESILEKWRLYIEVKNADALLDFV